MFEIIKRAIKVNIAQHYWNIIGKFKYYNQTVYFPRNSIIFKRAINEGIYEHDIIKIIIPLVKPHSEVFDIGANIGLIAIPILMSNYNIKVISIEASPNSLPSLIKTNKAFGDIERWTIIDKAVSDKEGKINFHLADSRDGAYDSINNTLRVSFKKTVEISCTTVDNIWKARNKPSISFIKSDIEGADLLALRGAIECIQQCRPSILIEWNYINIKPFNLINSNLLDFVKTIGYTIYVLPNFNKINSLNDLELLSNFTENFLLIPN